MPYRSTTWPIPDHDLSPRRDPASSVTETLDHSATLLYSDFFRPLVLPGLEEFAFDLKVTSDERLAELRQAIECLCLPDLLLEFGGAGMGNIVTVARSLPLTTMKAPEYVLFKFNMDIISRDLRFQKLTSLEMSICLGDTNAFIEMLKVRWSRARQLNTHLGIRSATIHVPDARKEDISRLSLDIREVQKQLGVLDSQIIFEGP